MIDWLEPLFDELTAAGLGAWSDTLAQSAQRILDPAKHGHFAEWQATVESMPRPLVEQVNLRTNAVTFSGDCTSRQRKELRASLMQFHPWRKGPFELFGLFLDAEWRSNLKWARIRPHLSLADKTVLDVGCGNGYYGWRMLGDGARCVVGLEPYPLYNAQFSAIRSLGLPLPVYVVPGNDQCLTEPIGYFDVVFSMGVLYHCKDPLGHLLKLRQTLKTDGILVLETLIIEGDANTAFVPADRYAKMRNVWLLPSTLMLERILNRLGFRHVNLVDVTRTTSAEQRRTEWMTFESLEDFLDKADSTKTVEGSPAPKRATLIARS